MATSAQRVLPASTLLILAVRICICSIDKVSLKLLYKEGSPLSRAHLGTCCVRGCCCQEGCMCSWTTKL
ncbi:Hypothetical predicted protein [Podarcis lilfordi]|uniref:Uncharacterized protein n=1 Tax=Podarcis lilfordi TaxID=74358 RepID=A0AA35KX05_9SAUR|nr:Hypothetical predicted protein [Podarcis lilfordi]